jgi:hypothetical protein
VYCPCVWSLGQQRVGVFQRCAQVHRPHGRLFLADRVSLSAEEVAVRVGVVFPLLVRGIPQDVAIPVSASSETLRRRSCWGALARPKWRMGSRTAASGFTPSDRSFCRMGEANLIITQAQSRSLRAANGALVRRTRHLVHFEASRRGGAVQRRRRDGLLRF